MLELSINLKSIANNSSAPYKRSISSLFDLFRYFFILLFKVFSSLQGSDFCTLSRSLHSVSTLAL